MTEEFDDRETKIVGYAVEYLRGYAEALEEHFSEALTLILRRELGQAFYPLYKKQIGENASLACLSTASDFYLFFVDEFGQSIRVLRELGDHPTFSREWTFTTPYEIRVRQVKLELGIESARVYPTGLNVEAICIPGTNFMASSADEMSDVGFRHGKESGNSAGLRADRELPGILEALGRSDALGRLKARYEELRDATMTPQARGQEFEQLWRDVFEFHGWKPKKFRISGEENDFTAIYNGLHILGEVRWFAEPMTGGKLREFLGKLDPRPQTIGLFISHSGLDEGAWAVVRRAANSKTVVVFDKTDIEAVFLAHSDPGPRFDEKLRDAYDYIFEKGQ